MLRLSQTRFCVFVNFREYLANEATEHLPEKSHLPIIWFFIVIYPAESCVYISVISQLMFFVKGFPLNNTLYFVVTEWKFLLINVSFLVEQLKSKIPSTDSVTDI